MLYVSFVLFIIKETNAPFIINAPECNQILYTNIPLGHFVVTLKVNSSANRLTRYINTPFIFTVTASHFITLYKAPLLLFKHFSPEEVNV